jgi:hypothetical protein
MASRQRISSHSITRFVLVALLGFVTTGWAATFPLSVPTRSDSFPLKRPSIPGTVVAWGGNSFGLTNVPSGLQGVVAIAAEAYHNWP